MKMVFCCLGVACKVLIPKEKQIFYNNIYLKGGMPESQPYSPEWLIDIDKDFCDKTGTYLVTLNDNREFTFNEIADQLELVYIHKILK